MFGRFAHIVTVALMLIGTVAPCLCWAHQASMPECHAAAEMKDCCCTKEAAVDQQMPARDLAVLPGEWQSPKLDLTCVTLYPSVVLSQSDFLPFMMDDRQRALRSPPDLYLLHAAFLI
ncbi:MAG: hypothetical protein OXI94_13595 [Gemmatimonadota bacterium]|nr:hypothetical protein [Gemmatimonadota bacterium]MDE2828581.1 hypothetical protein [Gemmatimonadota bacterium]